MLQISCKANVISKKNHVSNYYINTMLSNNFDFKLLLQFLYLCLGYTSFISLISWRTVTVSFDFEQHSFPISSVSPLPSLLSHLWFLLNNWPGCCYFFFYWSWHLKNCSRILGNDLYTKVNSRECWWNY